MAENFEDAIRIALRDRIETIRAEEELAACQRIHDRIGEEMDVLALKILSYYQIEHDYNKIIIEVKKP